ncbi:hypothetical protein Tco_0760390 [Tanacetum coccineum]
MMSSPNHFTSDIEDAFSSMNILNYISVSSDYFSASAGSRSFNSSENSNDNMTPPVISSFYNNTYLKDVQAIYAKKFPISSPDPIFSTSILIYLLILPPSLLFNPRYFFIPEELLPPREASIPHLLPQLHETLSFTALRDWKKDDKWLKNELRDRTQENPYSDLLYFIRNAVSAKGEDCLLLTTEFLIVERHHKKISSSSQPTNQEDL